MVLPSPPFSWVVLVSPLPSLVWCWLFLLGGAALFASSFVGVVQVAPIAPFGWCRRPSPPWGGAAVPTLKLDMHSLTGLARTTEKCEECDSVS